MNKIDFCECVETLRKYAEWERKMYDCGMDMNYTPVGALAEMFHGAICDFDMDFSYDRKLEFDWILEWTYSSDSPNFIQERHGITFNLSNAGALYEFLVYMNEHGWED